MSPARNRRVRGIALTSIVVVLLAGLLVARAIRSGNGEEPVAMARTADPGLAVTVHVVEQEALSDKIFATGTLRADEEVDLRSETAGMITRINFREGAPVARGTVLVKINDAELQAQLQQARHRLELARDREARQRTLLERGGVSQEAYDQVLSEYNIRQAEIELIKAQLDKMEIKAPFNGVIGLRYVSEGAYINQNTHIGTLQSIDRIKIDFAIPERYAGRIGVGDRIAFSVQGISGRFGGQIYAIEPRIDADTRTLQLRAITSNPGRRLLPGAFAEIELLLDQVEDALLVPSISLVTSADERAVFVVENGEAQRRPITTGVRTVTSVQVVDGLALGDTVITSGIQQLRSGMPVRILNIQ